MSKVHLVTDDDLARARRDPGFHYQLVVDNLRLLLDEIHHMRTARNDAVDCAEIREGVKLAVKLSELLQRIAHKRSEDPRAA
ncbi:MAG TPA: hypothetical protein VKD43_03380 [Xanthobacteraceae bacterium]|nr:hypothetical protein [Xanthobacteraceae bacterium]